MLGETEDKCIGQNLSLRVQDRQPGDQVALYRDKTQNRGQRAQRYLQKSQRWLLTARPWYVIKSVA